MKTITQSNSIQITNTFPKSVKFNNYFVRPLKAGFVGFAAILMIVFFINMLSFVVGSAEKFGMDYLDLLLAGVGFVLQLTSTLLKSFVR
jgi:hypothetical protein